MRARVMRMLASNAFESPAGTTLLGISAASGSVGGFSHARPRHCRHTRHCRPVSPSLLSPPAPSGCPLHCALLRPCASPVHGPCLALLHVVVCSVWC